jgi:RND family efflux transporter MFP subunit
VVLAPFLNGCKEDTRAEPEIVRPVNVVVVGEPSQGRSLTYSGVVRPRIESAIGFRVAGKIVERLVNVGDRVEVDHVIARLDEIDLRLAQNSANAAVASARSRREVARDNLERGKALLPRAIISQAAYDTRQNEMDAATSALQAAEAQLHQAVNAVGYATLKADKAGIVTGVMAEPGQVVNAGQTIITLAHTNETEISVAVPEQDCAYLAPGQDANIRLWAGPNVSLQGRIREIAGQADPAARTYAVRIAVSESTQMLRLGMTASVTLHIEDELSSVVVPIAALAEHGGGPAVFVVDPATELAHRTAVTLGGTAEDGVKVVLGLREGDLVVVGGVQFLRDGMRVRLPARQRTFASKRAERR